MRTLVTGGAGYVGSVCVERLLAEGHAVTVLDDLSVGHRAAVAPGAQFCEGNIGDPALLDALMTKARPEVVLHFAGSALVGESMEDPFKYFQNNTSNGITLLKAAEAAKVGKFIFSSTCAVYGEPETVPITETAPCQPVNPYGASKLMMEQTMEWQAQATGMECVALRYFNAAGASKQFGEHHRHETHIIPCLLQTALGQRETFSLFGTNHPTSDGTCIRDYIHVSDLAAAHALALRPGISGPFNLGRGHGDSVREVLTACREVTGHAIPVEEQPARPGDPPELVADVTKASAELGWQAAHTEIRTIVETAWLWHQRFPQGYPA
ncbi:UDP-glucose 4-epimerase GalE [Verrucomicrobia bacterium]|nr:UDP-glucose 4-epimerase GalE [Verrucomicrobiota bacterium]MDC0218432.1 UDP-glucose 4-epimerase GalE [Verrucomicrobiota bacterium]